MDIEIDYREKALIEILNNKQITFKTTNLLIGDIHITIKKDDMQETTPVLIIERKSLSDLAASIIDKRYSEQSYRLSMSEIPNHNIIYLIEGNIDNFKSRTRITKEIIENSMISLTFGKGFTVVKTQSVEDTANYIIKLFNKVSQKDKFSFYYTSNKQSNCNELQPVSEQIQDNANTISEATPSSTQCYLNTLKVSKKNNITQENIQPLMLSQIPGVSIVIAKTIMERYETIDKLIASIRQDKEEFKHLKMKDSSGKERRISKTALDNICCYLKI